MTPPSLSAVANAGNQLLYHDGGATVRAWYSRQ